MTAAPRFTALVTRPAPQHQRLCDGITAQGGRPIVFPTIAFAPPPQPAEFERAISQLDKQNWLIFISPQSVYATLPALRRAWPTLPPSVQVAAVGAGTARALAENGMQAVFPSDASSEGLLAMPVMQAVAHQQIAVVRGDGGREWIDAELAARGATVLPVIAYQRVLPKIDAAPVVAQLKQGEIDLIICTSFEGVRNLTILVGDAPLHHLPLIVMSERIKALASDLGFQTIWVPDDASDEAILQLIAQKGIKHE